MDSIRTFALNFNTVILQNPFIWSNVVSFIHVNRSKKYDHIGSDLMWFIQNRQWTLLDYKLDRLEPLSLPNVIFKDEFCFYTKTDEMECHQLALLVLNRLDIRLFSKNLSLYDFKSAIQYDNSVKIGSLDFIVYLYNRYKSTCSGDEKFPLPFSSVAFDIALANGYKEILDYLVTINEKCNNFTRDIKCHVKRKFTEFNNFRFIWDSLSQVIGEAKLMKKIIEALNLHPNLELYDDLLEFLVEEKRMFESDWFSFLSNTSMSNLVKMICKNGAKRLQYMKMLADNDARNLKLMHTTGEIMFNVISHGTMEILEYLFEKGFLKTTSNQEGEDEVNWYFQGFVNCIVHGDIDKIKYILDFNILDIGHLANNMVYLLGVSGKVKNMEYLLNRFEKEGMTLPNKPAIVFPANRNGFQEIRYLLARYPNFEFVITLKNLLDIQSSDDDLDLFKMVYQFCTSNLKQFWTIRSAIEKCQMEVIKFVTELEEQQWKKDTSHPDPTLFIDLSIKSALIHGWLEIVQYMYDKYYQTRNSSLSFSSKVWDDPEQMDLAASSGSLDVVKFIHLNVESGFTEVAMDNASVIGSLEIVKYLHENSYCCSEDALDFSARSGFLKIVKFLHFNINTSCTCISINQAAKYGHLEVLEFLKSNRNEQPFELAILNSVKNGHFKVVKFLIENYYNIFRDSIEKSIKIAQEKRYYEIIEYLTKYRKSYI
eukprot:gene2707-3358_t